MSSCFLSSRFLRPVGISVRGDKDEGETERASETGTERERKAERETQSGMMRTNSASIVHMAWLTF